MDLLYVESQTMLPGPHGLARAAAGLLAAQAANILLATAPEGENEFLQRALALLGERTLRADDGARPQTLLHLKIRKKTIPFFPDSTAQLPLFRQLALRGVQIGEPDGEQPSYFVAFRSYEPGEWQAVRPTGKPAGIVVASCGPKEEFDHTEFAHAT